MFTHPPALLFTARANPTQRGSSRPRRQAVLHGLDTCSTGGRTKSSCIRVAPNTHDRSRNVHARFFDRARLASPDDHAVADRGRHARAPLPRLRCGVQGFLPGARCCRGDTELGAAAWTLEWAAACVAGGVTASVERDRALDG